MDEPQEQQETAPDTEMRTLHRSSTKKIFGGVAGGISERFDVDATIVRVVFVVLIIAYGLGAALYLIMWALVPRASLGEGDVEAETKELSVRKTRWLRLALPLGVVVLAILFLKSVHGFRFYARGLTLIWILFLLVIVSILFRATTRRLTLRRLIGFFALSVVSFFVLLAGAFLIVIQILGVPLRGGSGVHEWHPITTSELQSQYRGAIGQSIVDLRNVPFTKGTWHITATQAVGELIVDVPANVSVDLITHVGIGGQWRDSPVNSSTASTVQTTGTVKPLLVLNLQVGIGRLEIRRF